MAEPVHHPPLKADHVTLMVRSMERSAPHYAALLPALGFTRTDGGNWTDGEGFFIQILQAKDDTADYGRYAPGMNHLGFSAPDEATVERVRTAMSDAGFEVPEIQHLGGARALFLKDPDGIRFEITYYPAGVPVVD